MKIDQTIRHGDPKRQGNCFAAAVATALGKPLKDVPHFIEWGIAMNGEDDHMAWWAMFLGYTFALGLQPITIHDLSEAAGGEIVFVAGKSPRGVFHQVLYRDGKLWHDPHPSRAGVLSEEEFFVLRAVPSVGHDHAPTPVD